MELVRQYLRQPRRKPATDLCCHKLREYDGAVVCVLCGQMQDARLDTSIMAFGATVHRKKVVTRVDRFLRLCKNICGFQKVPEEVLEACAHCATDYKALRAFVYANYKKYHNKCPSIWRQLGNCFRGLTPIEFDRLRLLFVAHERESSFLILIPYLLQQIGRDDLFRFIKLPSKFIQKKYNIQIKKTCLA